MLVDLCQVKYLQALSLPVHGGACQGKPSDKILGSGNANLSLHILDQSCGLSFPGKDG